MHPALCDPHSCGVCNNRLLEGNLGSIGKRCDHGCILSPLAREALLRSGVAVWVMQTLDVATQDRCDTDAPHKPIQIHHDARLVTVRIGNHNPGTVGIYFENWADRSI